MNTQRPQDFDAMQGKSLMEEEHSGPSILAVPPAAHGQRVLVLLRPETDSVQILAALKPLYNMDIQTFRRPKVLNSTALTDDKAPNILVLDADPSDETDLKLIEELKAGPCARIPVVVWAEGGAGAGLQFLNQLQVGLVRGIGIEH